MPRVLNGKVVSTGMDKTVVVEVRRLKAHPIYGKKYRVTKHYYAHDPENKARAGQEVAIKESKPISKRKRWVLAKSKDAPEVKND